MKGTAKVVKGRIEEAAGVLIDNDKLRAKGLVDQALGHIKQNAEMVKRAKRASVSKRVDKARNSAQKAEDKAKIMSPRPRRSSLGTDSEKIPLITSDVVPIAAGLSLIAGRQIIS